MKVTSKLFVTLCMPLTGTCTQRIFQFIFDARTSRGTMRNKTSWIIEIFDEDTPEVVGYGECGPLPGLSIDDDSILEEVIGQSLKRLSDIRFNNVTTVLESVKTLIPPQFPSVTFAFETALLDYLHGGKRIIFRNSFIDGKPLPINGLVWMGEADYMLEQVHKKVEQGFRCIKIKVGGLNFDEECKLLENVRKKYPSEQITLRLDANGAFSTDEALAKLRTLSLYDIHSIEQPVKPGLLEMKNLCAQSPIPIAFDEELIGKEDEKEKLLDHLRPSFIILKPTLHGGFYHCQEWIHKAERRGIGWWITSALESNIGLNAICQFTANYPVTLPQGLGTGSLYSDNFKSPLHVTDGWITYDPEGEWNVS